MRKLTGILLSAVVAISLTACGNSGKTTTTTTVTETQTAVATTEAATEKATEAATTEAAATEAATEKATEAASETEAQGGKTLVVYYSTSGNTKRVAEDIAEVAGADLFEIVPTEVYTSDDLNWTNSDSRVSKEHKDESLRDVPLTTTEVPDWDSYDTVFIGYPIWWGIAAWPVDSFVKANDFTGKTVIPFATSSSSGMGQSGSLLEEMAGTGDWQDGQRFSSGASAEDVSSWVESLNLK